LTPSQALEDDAEDFGAILGVYAGRNIPPATVFNKQEAVGERIVSFNALPSFPASRLPRRKLFSGR
jgi:hypothetical protein